MINSAVVQYGLLYDVFSSKAIAAHGTRELFSVFGIELAIIIVI
jgi:hypothetical protein